MIDYLKRIAGTSSRNEKIAILNELSESEHVSLAKTIFELTYDPRINFWVKEFNQTYSSEPSLTLEQAIKNLDKLSKREVTGNDAIDLVEQTCKFLSKDESDLFSNIIKRDLRAGISASTINKVFPNLIYEHPYMRCSEFSEKTLSKISFPCYSQTKMDGLYVDIIVSDDVKIYSRNGQDLTDKFTNPDLFKHLQDIAYDRVLMGEAICLDEHGLLMDRKSSNGYLNSDDIDSSRIRYFLWDTVTLPAFHKGSSAIDYSFRFDTLNSIISRLDSRFTDSLKVVDTIICNNKQDIINHFKQERILGNEGTVIKDFSGQWKDHTSPHQIKCKVIFDCDLKVTGFKYGTGKNEGKLGAITCESSDGMLEVSVGTGYKDSERESFLDSIEQWIADGQIATIRGNDVVYNENDPNKFSIFLPRFVEIRSDKTEADSLERIKEQVKSFTDLLDCIK